MLNTNKYVLAACLVLTSLLVAGCQNSDSGSQELTSTPLSEIQFAGANPTETVAATQTATASPTPLATSATVSATVTVPLTATPTATTVATPSSLPTPDPSANPLTPPTDMIYIDHNDVVLFEQIPEEYLAAAANIPMLFIDRSVGVNISEALDCLAFPSHETAPHYCSVYKHAGTPAFDSDPSEVSWSREGGYGRDNWHYETWPENDCRLWQRHVPCFTNRVTELLDQYQVFSFKFSYLEVTDGSTIADQPNGFFSDIPTPGDVNDLATFEAQHPDKIIIYWTTSLARSIGTETSDQFNDQVRQYAIEHNKVLFDLADILSHDPDGNPCYDNRDGQPYSNQHTSENYPDDGRNHLAICQHYTTETEGGHLGSTSTGAIRAAKALWVLMARLAGWNGVP